MNARRDFTVAAAVTGAILVGTLIIGTVGWPGEPSSCIEARDCHCEAFTGGTIEQPVNTLSNLAFVAVGLWVLWMSGRTHSSSNPMTTEPLYPRLYGAVAIFLGVGSMMFHGSMTRWGHWLDLVSMYAFILFFLAYELRALGDRPTEWFMRLYSSALVVLAAAQWALDDQIGRYIFGGLIVVALVANRLVVRRRPGRDERWFWAGLLTYVGGNIVWAFSRDGAALCTPESIWQGHGLWHVTSAAAVAGFYLYFRSETGRAGSDLPDDRQATPA